MPLAAGALRQQPAEGFNAIIRAPRSTDGARVWSLVRATETLDDNSLYCNLLQTTHFAATCAVAERDGDLLGWVSGYIPPGRAETLFVWQVCVGEAARGQGLARRLIGDVLARPACQAVTTLACTITPGNKPSWGLFGAIARTLKAQMRQVEMFDREAHFGGRHDSEHAVSIGPFNRQDVTALSRH